MGVQVVQREKEISALQSKLLDSTKQAAVLSVQLASLQSERDRLASELAALEQRQRASAQQVSDLQVQLASAESEARSGRDRALELELQVTELLTLESSLKHDRQTLKV